MAVPDTARTGYDDDEQRRLMGEALEESRKALPACRPNPPVGAVVVRNEGGGQGLVELDYVTERFRDCSPGAFVYGTSGVFDEHGLRRLVAAPELAHWSDYLTRVGFRRDGDSWVRDLAEAA